MHLKFPYFTYLHLSRTITRIACKILSCTRNLLRKVIKKKKIPRFVEFTWLQTDVTCSMRSSKIEKTEKSDTAFEESCERITQQASCSFRFVIILETRARLVTRRAAWPTSRTILPGL